MVQNTDEHACEQHNQKAAGKPMTFIKERGHNVELAEEQAHGRQAQNAQHTGEPEGCRMGHVLNHAMDTHHITRLVLLNNGTGNIEQHEFNHGMAIHMQHHSLDGQRGKGANTSYHDADIFHGGISQNTLHIALYNHKGHRHCHGQHGEEQQHTAHHLTASGGQYNNQITK